MNPSRWDNLHADGYRVGPGRSARFRAGAAVLLAIPLAVVGWVLALWVLL